MSSYEIVPDLAVVCVAGSVGQARRFLRSAYDTADHVSLEVFVVAGEGMDSEPLEVEFSGMVVCPLTGNVAKGINTAIKRSTARYVSFWDDGAVVAEGCLVRLVNFLDDEGEVGIVGPKMRSEAGFIQQVARTFPPLLSILNRGLPGKPMPGWDEYASGEADWLVGSGMVVSRLLLDDIGTLSSWLPLWQLDLCRRANRAGWHVHYLNDAQVAASLTLWQEKMAGRNFLQKFVIRNFQLLFFR